MENKWRAGKVEGKASYPLPSLFGGSSWVELAGSGIANSVCNMRVGGCCIRWKAIKIKYNKMSYTAAPLNTLTTPFCTSISPSSGPFQLVLLCRGHRPVPTIHFLVSFRTNPYISRSPLDLFLDRLIPYLSPGLREYFLDS